MKQKIKFLAYYLPQYHPIPENDKWWGKGFTEWTNVAKSKPLFKGHHQPILPSDLGFYDLRVPEVQEKQSELALQYGIDGFIYYQYWFGDNSKMLLEKPAEAMLKNTKIKIPFCFCWANEAWKGIWHGLDNPSVLMDQSYPTEEEGYIAYFNYLLPFFKDERYIKVDNKPMFHIYKFSDIPDNKLFHKTFHKLAKENGFDGVYFVATSTAEDHNLEDYKELSAIVSLNIFNQLRYYFNPIFKNRHLRKFELRFKDKLGYTSSVIKRKKPLILDYKELIKHFAFKLENEKSIPCAVPNWDNSARSGKKSMILNNSNPTNWEEHLNQMVNLLIKSPKNPPFLIIKSWNEWAEGNYLEPDTQYKHDWLKAVLKVKNGI